MTPADVSVVIPALDEAENIESSVESALAAGATQVIVSDGGSSDKTIDLAERAGAITVKSPRGRGPQISEGALQASGDFLLFLHADNRLSPDCLSELCAKAQRNEQITNFWGGFRQRIDSKHRVFRLIESGNAARIRFRGMPFGDQAMFVSRILYDEVGGIPRTMLMEDVGLSRRLRKKSWPNLLENHVWVDARRWEKRGVLLQTGRNWAIQVAHKFGVTERRLDRWYR